MGKPKLKQLEMLVAVSDCGGFGSAAAQLGCTQSRISHAISELESLLGTSLLRRSRVGCVPTESGSRVLVKARQILAIADTIDAAVSGLEAVAGRVRIACFRSVSTHLLPDALNSLAIAHPHIRVDVDDSFEKREDLVAAIEGGRADLGIAQLPVGPRLETRPYVSDSYVLVAPAAFQLRAPVGWEQLRVHPYIQLDCSGALAAWNRFRSMGFDVEPSRTLATDSGVLAMVKQGSGFSILPQLAVFPVPAGVETFALPVAAPRQFALVCSPDARSDKAVGIVGRLIGSSETVERTEAFRSGIVHW
jgi:DNA-binding transcriptional LysR family regulator